MNFDNLKDLWQQQSAPKPDIEALHHTAGKFKKTATIKMLLCIIALIFTAAFIIGVWIRFQPQLITTKIGLVLILLAILLFVVASTQSIGMFRAVNMAETNTEYIDHWMAVKQQQKKMQTLILSLYFILLSAGLALYMYEYAVKMSFSGALLAYGLTGAWILFNWFYVRPRHIKKQNSKLDEIIDGYRKVMEQLGEDTLKG
ncbi:hypothetical protein [Taibaiella soli]|uniref:Uncharacterized protein n=1 Tax=Taibaiella soli TaxID=1649169 RepID=A0A2W2A8K2_9BACT|nr:hypothetical protein [Taibaiella soli]PZF71635.1 hypothetical protein DN068_16315 [Taibaiella soli]